MNASVEKQPLMARSRALVPIRLVAAVHLAFTAYAILASLYFTLPGEPGFDPRVSERAAFFGEAFVILGFPLLPILTRFPASPFVDGLLGWIWLGLNSLLWGAAIVAVWRTFARLLARRPSEDNDAA